MTVVGIEGLSLVLPEKKFIEHLLMLDLILQLLKQ
jgi:hypothetical protein